MTSERLKPALALGDVEFQLVEEYPDLNFYLIGQAHYGQVGFAFIEVHGVEDQAIRRQTRGEAGEKLRGLSFPVDLIAGNLHSLMT